MPCAKLLIHHCAFSRIPRSDRTASDQEPRFAFGRVGGDAPPKQMQQVEVAMLSVDTGAAEFDHFAAKRFERRKIKFSLAVIPKICRRELTRLQPIGPDNFASGAVFDDQMIAKFVKRIDVETSRVRFGQSF